MQKTLCTYQCQARGGKVGHRAGFWPIALAREVGHLNYLAVPGVGIFEFLFVPVTRNHFPGGEFPRGREFDSNFLENVKIPPYAPPSPRGLDIDRCITFSASRFEVRRASFKQMYYTFIRQAKPVFMPDTIIQTFKYRQCKHFAMVLCDRRVWLSEE